MSRQSRTAYLYLTHFFDEFVEEEFLKLVASMKEDEDAYLLFHQHPGTSPPDSKFRSFCITNDDIESLGYQMMQKRILPGHLVFMTILFANAHPEYDHYWTIEQDVRFTGKWSVFFGDVNRSKADMLTAHLRRFCEEPGWLWWDSFNYPHRQIPRSERVAAFSPIYRLSQKALGCLKQALENGCAGHSEVLVPTVLSLSGYQVNDLNFPVCTTKPYKAKRYYTSVLLKSGQLHYGGTLRHFPARRKAGVRRNKLYHPVKAQKTDSITTELRIRRMVRSIRVQYRSLIWRVNLRIRERKKNTHNRSGMWRI